MENYSDEESLQVYDEDYVQIDSELTEKLKEFSQKQKKLLDAEREKEMADSKILFESNSLQKLEEKGVLIRELEYYESHFTSYGKYDVLFKRSNQNY